MATAFAVWITGLPAAGKSTIARALAGELARGGVDVAVLESDALRGILTPRATYTDADREAFYRAFAYIGRLLVSHGVPVIFDATANRASYRAHARQAIERFAEIYVDTPIEMCAARDPKGLYRGARAGAVRTLPGLQSAYEPPDHPAIVVTERDSPDAAARSIATWLREHGWARAPAAGREVGCR